MIHDETIKATIAVMKEHSKTCSLQDATKLKFAIKFIERAENEILEEKMKQ